jgi:hypothetical protein
MNCPVFRGIGGVANKYYLLFQHHLAPPATSFTTGKEPVKEQVRNSSTEERQDAPPSAEAVDQRQLENTFVLKGDKVDSSYIIGHKPGVSSPSKHF